MNFVLTDVLCLQIAFVLAHFVITREFSSPFVAENNIFLLAVMTVCHILAIVFSFNYETIIRRGPYEEIVNVLRTATMMFVMVLVYLFVLQQTKVISRLMFGWTTVLYVAVDWLGRTLEKRRIKWKDRNNRGKTYSTVLMTDSGHADKVMQRMSELDFSRERKIGAILLTDDNSGEALESKYNIPVYHMDDEMKKRIQKGWVDEVFCYQPSDMIVDTDLLNSFVDMGLTVHMCPERLNDSYMPTEVNTIGNFTVLTSRIRFFPTGQVIIKRLMDIAGGIVGCVITLILMVIIGPLIYIKSPGPVIFSQVRIGRSGRKFRMYKFRSMYMDAEKRRSDLMEQNKIEDGRMFKIDDDPRIIGSEKKDKNGRPCGIGNFIRNTSIDEFPQFWNVLKGDMSLVGTRPPLPDEWEKYDPHHRARMTVNPGITGLWQISGRSEITDFEEVVKLDLEYIRTWDIKLDIKIILKTIVVVLKGRGAE